LKPHLIRYADDLVVLCEDLEIIQRVHEELAGWLRGIGLEFHPSKTRITHTLAVDEGRPGFDFLGFNVRLFPVGKTSATKNNRGKRVRRVKLIIRPSDEAMKRHHKELSDAVDRLKAATPAALIRALAPKVTGWTRYYRSVASARWFDKADYRLHQRLRRWGKHRHPNKGTRWQYRKYWVRGWTFGSKDGRYRLPKHRETHIVRHVKVRGPRSPYDGDWVYWSTRLGRHPELPRRVAKLLQRQGGRCAHCGLFFKPDDLPEVDHIIPRSAGGDDAYSNWQLLHRHCHDTKTATRRGAS
jgi:RNA-directed DNA polymerase